MKVLQLVVIGLARLQAQRQQIGDAGTRLQSGDRDVGRPVELAFL